MQKITVRLQETTGGNCLTELLMNIPALKADGLLVTIEDTKVDEVANKTTMVVSLETEAKGADLSAFLDSTLGVYRILGSDVQRLPEGDTNE